MILPLYLYHIKGNGVLGVMLYFGSNNSFIWICRNHFYRVHTQLILGEIFQNLTITLIIFILVGKSLTY